MLISLFDLVTECPHLESNIGEVYRAFSSSVLNAKFLAFSTPKKKKNYLHHQKKKNLKHTRVMFHL